VERTPDLRRTRRERRLLSIKWDKLAWRIVLHLEERSAEWFRATWYNKTTWNESADVRHAISFLFSAPAPPKTMTKEWQEASTEMAKEQKINPITGKSRHTIEYQTRLAHPRPCGATSTGISADGYAGKGFVSAWWGSGL
jgi:hypothetical protein